MARHAALPILTAEPGLTHYLEEIRRFPMLERREEYILAKRWREHGDRDAAHKLVTSHLRLVTKIARVCVPKTLSVLMTPRNHLSWRNDRAPVFRRGGLGLAIQVEDPAGG